jgi:excisionase family DNA binding protein
MKKEKNSSNSIDDLITVTEAAQLRGVSRAAIHELVQRGRLRSEKMFGRVLLYRSEVEAFERDKPGPKKENA